MPQPDVQAGPSSHDATHSMGHVVRSYLLKEWSSAILVAAVVFLIHHNSNWLNAIDGYAFMAIGQLGFVAEPKGSESAIALLIDSETYETRYLERSPLSRCALLEDLTPLYAANPDLVAIDIDISPALWTVRPAKSAESGKPTEQGLFQSEVDCEDKLYSMIKQHKKKTVIMEPFDVSDQAVELKKKKAEWKTEMEQAGIKFGQAQLPVNYGLVIGEDSSPTSFAAQARKLVGKHTNHSQKDRIDPREYARITPITISELNSQANSKVYLTAALDKTMRPDRVAFYGAAFGKDDIFMTPVGEVYGVEVQAAAYLSDGLQQHPILDLLVDIVIAIVFGILIAVCWNRYFVWRLSQVPKHRQLARLWIAGLVVAVLIMGMLISLLSLWLLARLGIWASPIPIAVGMLIDSFVSGSIDQAVHAGQEDKQTLIAKLLSDFPNEPALQAFLTSESKQRSHDPKDWLDGLRRHFGGDIKGLWSSGHDAAAGLLLVWSLVWLLTVGWAIKICLSH